MVERLRSISRPAALLALVSVLSFGARIAWIGEPCHQPCRSANDHLLVFDEAYYVNAARVIAGVAPPPDQNYSTAPLGDDPNAEHPQLAKLLIAGSIEVFGDGPLAWRLTSVVFGSLAIVGMFALVRAAGGGPWLALGATTLMASDNLLLVHGRIGTLDVPVLAMMIWAAVLYLRGRPLLGGAVLGIGMCIKLVAPYVLLVLALFELLRVRRGGAAASGSGWRPAVRIGSCALAAGAVFVALLAILDRIAPPYDAYKAKLVHGGPLAHIAHMLSYAASQSSPHGPQGIASYPWTWIVDYKPIVYLNVNPSRPTAGLHDIQPAVHFLGMISPSILVLALPSLALAVWAIARRRRPQRVRATMVPAPSVGELPALGLAWFAGALLPFALLSVFYNRTSYLYYMVVVMPGIYLTISYLIFEVRRYRKVIALWALCVLVATIVMYPLTPLPLP